MPHCKINKNLCEDENMKKITAIIVTCMLLCVLAVPVMAADDGPVITLQPQSPTYTQYDVALYIVKAEGKNLSATWYLQWQGKEYNISKIGGSMQPWEAYAGESYGARKLDDNTFSYTFEGIEYDMDGAMIWCVISDGTNTVTSQKVRVSVKDFGLPPRIVDFPAQLTVEQGEEAELRCVATSPAENVQLTYRWFETKTGSMDDMEAVTEAETADFLVVDTSVVGTRNYLCLVETSEGGIAYSSIVPVTVTKKTEAPDNPVQNPDDPVQDPDDTPDKPDDSDKAEDIKQEQSQETVKQPENTNGTQKTPQEGTPWWALVLVGVAAAAAGVGVAVLLVKKKG